MNNLPYITYIHKDSEITTVSQFVSQFGLSIVRSMSAQEVKQYADVNGETNYDKLWKSLSPDEKITYQQQYESGVLDVLPYNCALSLPKANLFRETLAITGVNQVSEQKTFSGFLAAALRDLLNDRGYSQTFSYNDGRTINSVTSMHPHVTVWIWCRSLGTDQDPDGVILDVSPFIRSVSMNNDANGGNFDISLAPIICERTEAGGWEISKSSVYGVVDVKNSSIVATSSINRVLKGKLKRNQFLFHNGISTNDLVFIRLEALEAERNTRFKSRLNPTVSKVELASTLQSPKIYDMIGLVDSNSISAMFADNSVDISISGKDLSKVLIDDGSYFYPLQFAQGVFINPKENDKLIKRLAIDGQFILQSAMSYRSIRYSVQYIVNHLSNMGIVPDSLFTSYQDRRVKVYRLDQSQSSQDQQERSQYLDGLKRSISQEIEDVLQANGQENVPQTQITQLSDDLLNFAQSAMSSNSLQFNASSISGWSSFQWNAILVSANSTPTTFSSEGIFLLKTVSSVSSQQVGVATTQATGLFEKAYEYVRLSTSTPPSPITEKLASGVWQIINFVFDENIADRRIADPSISQPDGSLIEQMRKLCMSPFVEFFSDTYGDQFYFIIRQPPFDQQSILSFLRNSPHTEQDEGSVGEGEIMISIDSGSVINENFSYSDSEVYSFYELKPQGLFAGQGSEVSLAYIPIVYFPQYADIWGSRRLSIVSQYLPYSGLSGSNSDQDSNYLVRQSAKDLKYLIDTHAYLPFTRSGTITIYGNRTIKKGTWIRYVPTGEIFYVDRVSHSFSIALGQITRTTTISVSRGMIEKYVSGVDVDGIKMSYFNIIDTELIEQFIISSLSGQARATELELQIQRNFAVNQKVFDFFNKRRQLD